MEDGNTEKGVAAAAFLEDLEGDFRDACASMTMWLATGGDTELAKIIFWLTRVGNFEVFKSCLFALQCETDMFFDVGPKQVEFYSSHPWVTRAAMRELLEALLAIGGSPTPHVLLSCALQHSASIMPQIEMGTFDPDRVDPLTMIRAHPIWAEGVIAAWATGGPLDALWGDVRADAAGNSKVDARRLPSFAKLCDTISVLLLAAWKRDMEAVRWKAEESAFLSMKALLPRLHIERHAMPSWLAPQHLDILIPSARVAIEYQGEQHYRPVALFGGEDGFAATVRRDENKRQLCRLAGIRLEYVRFDEDAALRLRQIADLCSDEMEKRRN